MNRVSLAIVLIGASLAAAVAPADAQAPTPVGTTFVYQGHLQRGPTPATGSYDFRVTLFDAATGGSPAGAPSQVVREDVPVASGVFLLALDFGGAAFGAPRWIEIAVRPGASTGDYTVLASRQPVTPTPEALHARSARTVNGLACADGQVLKWQASGWSCGADIASVGTVSAVIAGAGLTGGTIVGAGTVGVADGGVTSAMLAPGSVSNRALASGAVGGVQIDTAAVQARNGGACPSGLLQGFGADGAPICAPVGASPVLTRYAGYRLAAAALRPDGRPVIAVQPPSSNTIRLLICEDRACTRLSGDVAIGTGTPDAIVVPADDRPAVLTGTSVIKCADSGCTSVARNFMEVLLNSPRARPAMMLGADGLPFIVWQDQKVKTGKCLDAACSIFEAAEYDAFTSPGTAVSAALGADGRPVVAYGYYDAASSSPFGVRVLHCGAANCLSGVVTPITTRAQAADVAIRPSGLPTLAYRDIVSNDVVIVECTNAACATRGQPIRIGSSTFAPLVDIAFAGDRLVSRHEDWKGVGFTAGVLATCTAPGCTAQAPALQFPGSAFADSRALLVDADGLPFLMYVSERPDPGTGVLIDSALVTLKCRTATCQ